MKRYNVIVCDNIGGMVLEQVREAETMFQAIADFMESWKEKICGMKNPIVTITLCE